jgi:hypothetical protein
LQFKQNFNQKIIETGPKNQSQIKTYNFQNQKNRIFLFEEYGFLIFSFN